MKSGIYRIVVSRPAKSMLIYIGQAVDLDRRERDHFRHMRGERHDNRRLQTLFKKYGADCFSFQKVLICEPQMLRLYEQAILDFYISSIGRRVLNICRECVTSSAGTKMSRIARQRMSLAKKGKPGRRWTDESRAKSSAARKGIAPSRATIQAAIDARRGVPVSAETRYKRSAALKGRIISLETRAKMSASRIKLYESAEARARLSASLLGNSNCLGNKHSPEARAKMSAAAIKREASKRARRDSEQSNSEVNK